MPSIGSPPPIGPSVGPSGPRKTARSSSSDQSKIREAQADVANKVTQLQEQAKQVAIEGQTQVDQLRENYEREALAESSRQETQLASEKTQGYEKLREIQRAQNKEEARIKREGEAELARLNDYYRDAEYKAAQRGDELLRTTESKNTQQLNFELESGNKAAEQLKHDKRVEIEQIQADRDLQVATAEKQAHDLYEKKHEATQMAIEQSTEKLDNNYRQIAQTHQETLARLNNETYSQLQRARLDTSKKLSAYSERQEDPFYKLMDLQAEFDDQGDKYVLTARVPEHEQKNVSIAIRGNQIVLSGTRRNEERVEVEPGHQKGTSSYQSFMESFPFAQAVESRMMTHEFRGDQVIVTVPKKLIANEYHPHKMKPARAQVQKPDFPANLPHVGDEATSKGEVSATRGSSTLVKE
ncbi:MAG: Hsp20 family protein [Bdellovibrionia bacterium]